MEHRRDVPSGDLRAVRPAVRVEGRSQHAVAREFGLSRETVRKMLAYAVPPGYQRQQPIKRIFDRLRDEHGFTGGYTIVKDYVRGEQVRSREMFVPLTYAPGEAQADFGDPLALTVFPIQQWV
jgi:transposase